MKTATSYDEHIDVMYKALDPILALLVAFNDLESMCWADAEEFLFCHHKQAYKRVTECVQSRYQPFTCANGSLDNTAVATLHRCLGCGVQSRTHTHTRTIRLAHAHAKVSCRDKRSQFVRVLSRPHFVSTYFASNG